MTSNRQSRAAPPSTDPCWRERGITLIELVAVLAIVAIVTAISLPSLSSAVTGTHSTVVGNRLLADMARARLEAVMTHFPSVVCPSTDGSTCNRSANWSNGWIVFVDQNGDDQRSDSEPLLSAVSASDIGGLQVATTADRSEVRFLPDGLNGGTNLSLRICDGTRLTREVVINMSGRARLERLDAPNTDCK